jgi:hypothetical protein
MNIQMTAVPRVDTKFGKFELGIPQLPPGAAATVISRYVQNPIQQLNPSIHQAPVPAPAPQAPGAILPTQAPTYLFPTTTEQTPAASTPKDNSTTTLLVVGGLVIVGVIAAVMLLKD